MSWYYHLYCGFVYIWKVELRKCQKSKKYDWGLWRRNPYNSNSTFFRFYSALCEKTHVHSFQKVRTHTADCFGYGWAVDNYKVFAINAVIYQIGEPAKMKMVLKNVKFGAS